MTSLNFEIKPFDFNNNELVSQAIELLNEDSSRQSHTKDFWEWRFENNPFGEPLGWYIRDTVSDKLACILLFWPWIFTRKDSPPKLFYQAINGKTSTSFKNKGLFFSLNKQAIDFFNEKKIYLYGFPNEQSLPSYKKLKWLISGPLNPVLVPIFNFLPEWKFKKRFNNALNENELKLKHDNGPEAGSNLIQTNWSEEIIKWRFHKHPGKVYSIYAQKENIILYRIIKRSFFKEAKIVMSQLNSEFKMKDFKIHLKENKISLFTYIGLNTRLSDEINKLTFKFRIKKKLYFVHNYMKDQDKNNFRIELAESDSQ